MSPTPDNVVNFDERPTDAQLVERALAGDMLAKRAIFERYVTMASGLAFRLVGGDRDLEDIVQESFISAFQQLARLERPQALRSWLAAIVTGTAIGTLRRRQLLYRLGLLRREPFRLEFLTATTAPPDVVTELRQVYSAVDRLPAVERVTLILRRVEQLSLEQIAEQTNTSLATVKRRLVRAEKILLDALSDPEPSP